MLDIESDLQEAEDKFISLADLASVVWELSQPKKGYAKVAEWLLLRLKKLDDESELPRLVTMNHFFELVPVSTWDPDIDIAAGLLLDLKKHNCLPFNHPLDNESGEYWMNDSLFNVGFDRLAIAEVLPDVIREYLTKESEINAKNKQVLDGFDEESVSLPPEAPVTMEFRGRDSLLEIIAGQATYIGKVSGKHIRATGINKSALAKDVYDALCDFGKGMSIDPDQCRKIIGEALKLKTSLNMDYMNLEGERQFAQDHE